MKRTRHLLLVLALGTVTFASACGATDGDTAAGSADAPKIQILTTGYTQPVVKAVLDNLVVQGKKKGWDMRLADAPGDTNKVNSFYQDAVARKVDVIIDAFNNTKEVGLGLTAAKKAGIPVFGFDAGTEASPLLTQIITSDNGKFGATTARAMIDLMGGKGTVMMVTYTPLPSINLRAVEARKVFDAAGIKVLKTIEVQNPVTAAAEVANGVTDTLTANPGAGALQGVWGGWDQAAVAASQAVSRSGRPGIVVTGTDGSDQGIAEIKTGGPMKMTVKLRWDDITEQLLTSIDGQLSGTAPAEAFVAVDGDILTAESLGVTP